MIFPSHRQAFSIALFCAGLYSCALSANDDNSLDTLEAIGESTYQTGDLINEEISLSSETISEETLTRAPGTLAEIISRETGIQHRQSGGFGSFATVSIRAASAAQTGVFLDGILLNSGGQPVIDLSTLEILNLGQVDIYRGGSPSQLGHGGIGGAINLSTKRAGTEPTTKIRLEAGSFSHYGAQLSRQARFKQWDLIASLSHRQSKNDFSFLNGNGTPLNPDDDAIERRQNAAVERTSGLFKLGYQHDENRRTDLTLQTSHRDVGVPEWRNQPDNTATFETTSTQVQLTHVIDQIGNWNSRQSVYWHGDENHYQDPDSSIGLGAQNTLNLLNTIGVRSYWEYPGDSGLWTLFADFRNESVDSDESLDNFADFEAERDKFLATAQYTWFGNSDQWSVSPSIRWQQNSAESVQRLGPVTTTDRDNDKKLGAQLGVNYLYSDTLKFSANAGTYFRSPSFGELYGSIGLVSGNPLLEPEDGVNADVGFEYSNDSLTIKGTLFSSLRSELIVTSFDSRGVGRPVNAGKAEVIGTEFSGIWTPSQNFSVQTNVTWQSARSKERFRGFFNKVLPGEARLSIFTRAEYIRGPWSFWYELDIRNGLFYDRANILPAEDVSQHSAGFQWQSSSWEWNFSANNLGDENVEDFNGFPRPGRYFSISLSHTL